MAIQVEGRANRGKLDVASMGLPLATVRYVYRSAKIKRLNKCYHEIACREDIERPRARGILTREITAVDS